jgi:membrane-associated HD superfamily phosphohydrolase
MIYLAGFFLVNDEFPQYFQLQDWRFDLSEWKNMQTAWPTVYLLILTVIMIPVYWLGYRKIMLIRKKRPLFIVLAAAVAWIIVIGVQPATNNSVVFLVFPLAVAVANLTERNQQRPITEILLWAFLLLPFAARMVI